MAVSVLDFALCYAAFISLLCAILVALRENLRRRKIFAEKLAKLNNTSR